MQGHRLSGANPASLLRAESSGGTVRMTSLSRRSSSTGASLAVPLGSPMLRAHLMSTHSQSMEGGKGAGLDADGNGPAGKPQK